MRTFKFDKLVRDKIVPNMINAGDKPNYKVLSNKQYVFELKRKIAEESSELPKASEEEILKELADVQEAIDALLLALNISKEKFLEIQIKKREKAGGFKERHYILEIKTRDDSSWIDYYLANPDRYPEIKP